MVKVTRKAPSDRGFLFAPDEILVSKSMLRHTLPLWSFILVLALLSACDPPPEENAANDLPVVTTDTVQQTPVVEPTPPSLSPKDSLVLVDSLIVRLKSELEQVKKALTKAEKNRERIAKEKGLSADQRARDIRDASIAVDQNSEAIKRAQDHLLQLENAKARLEVQVKEVL
jgi:hypothetical protein